MTFGTNLRDHHTVACSANMFYIAIAYKNKTNNEISIPVI